MAKSKERITSSIVSINPYNNVYLSGVSNYLTHSATPEYSKEQFCISYLNTKGFITSRIEISKNIPDDDLHDAITNKVYDDLALDQALTYKIQFIETFNTSDEEHRFFHVFIINPLELNDIYEKAITQVKYIDIIIPAPLLLKSLYTKNILDTKGAHCFVYLQENDAFITVYNHEEFVYTKSIPFSFIEMHEKFNEMCDEKIEYDDFIKFVSQENLKESQSKYKEKLIQLYLEMLSSTNEIITYVKKVYQIEKIEHLYIGSELDSITKLNEIAEVELSIKSSEFEFDYGHSSDMHYVDQLHSLMQLYTKLEEDLRYNCNFTIYHRPPRFIKRVSGQMILLSAASIIISFIYPGTYWALTYASSLNYKLLNNQYIALNNERISREITIRNKEADKTKVIKLLKSEEQDYIRKKESLVKIHDVKVNYPMKAKLLSSLVKELNKYNVNVSSFSYSQSDDTKFTFNLVSFTDKDITKLLEHLTQIYDGRFHFYIEEILYEEDIKRYLCQMKVKIS